MQKFKPLWEAVKQSTDVADVLSFFTPWGGAAMIWAGINWAQENVPTTSLVLFAVGFAIILLPLLVYGIARYVGKLRRNLKNPESLILPYIARIDASQLKHGKNSVTVSYSFPSALAYDLTFIKVRCRLVIDGSISTPQQEMSPLVVKARHNNIVHWVDLPLGDIEASVKERMKEKVEMEYRMEVFCWDNANKEHRLDTELNRQMIALV